MRLLYEQLTDIPSGFTEVEYLQSTGTQWIDTGVYVNNTLKTDIHFEVVDKTQGGHIFGGRTVTSGGRGYGVYLPTSGGIGFDYETRLTSNVSTTNGYKYRVVKNGASNTLYVNGVQSYTGNNTNATFDLNVTMALFYMKDSNTSFNASVKCKVFYFKIWDNGTLVRDFVPCLDSSSVPCMWDRVEGKAYYNKGTGSFTYGRKIIPVEYLESSGTQYIDTGIKGKSDISAKTKVNYTYLSGTGSHAIGGEYASNTSCYFGMVRANGHFTYLYKTSVVETTTTLLTNTDYDIDITLNNGNQKFVINGNTVSTGTVSGDFISTNNLFLYAINSVNGADVYGSLKMYYMQVWDDGTLVRDYTPCKDENGVGFMFDKVAHTCYLNAGTGSFIVGNELPRKKLRLIKTSTRKLPFGFTEVEYLASNGNQWIDTEYKMQSGKTSTFEGNIMWTASQGTANFFYGYRSVNSAEYRGDMRAFFIYGTTTTPPGRIAIRYGVDTENSTAQSVYLNQACKVSFDGTNFKVNDNTVATHSKSYTPANYQNMWLFNCNTTGYYSADVSHFIGRIYNWKIFSDGELVRDFIPCLDASNVPCMYDLVEGKAYYNAGTGSFNYGHTITLVEYLESSGTQYINTGVKLTNNHSVELDYQLTQASQSRAGLFGALNMTGSNQGRFGSILSPSNQQLEHGYGAGNDYWQQGLPNTSRHKIYQKKNEVYFDGTLVHTFNSATFSLAVNAYLGNFVYTNYTPAKAKYYSSKWWDNDTLVRDYVPCKDENGVGYMFDKVTHSLYANAGTGAFAIGDEIKQDVTRFILDDIPNIYQKVEYLQSTGTQYINTEIKPNNNTIALYNCAVIGDINNKDSHIFGSRLSASSEAFDLAYMNTTPNGLETLRFISGSAYTQVQTPLVTATTIKNNNAYYMSSTQVKVNGTQVLSFTTSAYQGTYNLWLFGVNNAGTLHNQVVAQKVYGCKIWNNNTITRDFIPVIRKSDSKPGMYDRVTKQFFTNAGTGEFTHG